MASTTPVAPAGELDQPVDLLSPQARKLWASYQSAAGTLGESLRDLGFVDLVRLPAVRQQAMHAGRTAADWGLCRWCTAGRRRARAPCWGPCAACSCPLERTR